MVVLWKSACAASWLYNAGFEARSAVRLPMKNGFAMFLLFSVASGALLAGLVAVVAQERQRDQIPDRFKWNLTDIYPTDAAWRTAKEAFTANIGQLDQYKGQLSSSARMLATDRQ